MRLIPGNVSQRHSNPRRRVGNTRDCSTLAAWTKRHLLKFGGNRLLWKKHFHMSLFHHYKDWWGLPLLPPTLCFLLRAVARSSAHFLLLDESAPHTHVVMDWMSSRIPRLREIYFKASHQCAWRASLPGTPMYSTFCMFTASTIGSHTKICTAGHWSRHNYRHKPKASSVCFILATYVVHIALCVILLCAISYRHLHIRISQTPRSIYKQCEVNIP